MSSTKTVGLTEPEQALAAQINFEPSRTAHDATAVRASGEAAAALMKSLKARKAIPEVRVQWFTDPEYNVGGHGASRQDIFVKNGARGDDILRHPHFLKHLHYFIYGPDLPASVIEIFEQEVADCGGVTSGDIIPLGNHAKQQVRTHGLDTDKAAEEFYKLALESGLDASDARSIRDAVKKAKR
jgi:hypothetical protein